MTVTVDEARTLLGTAFIFSEVFDEYTYHAEPPPPRAAARPQKPKLRQADPNASGTESDSENGDNKEELDNAAFEIPLNTLIECLNIFGTAGAINATASISGSSGNGGAPSNSKQAKKWRRVGDGDSDGEGRVGGRGLEAYFGPGAGEKRTGMRLSYAGAGYPLTLIVYVLLVVFLSTVLPSDKSLIEQKMQLDLRRHVKSLLSIQNLSLSCIMTMIKRMFLSFSLVYKTP
jgi:cell cycle checkpoint protein